MGPTCKVDFFLYLPSRESNPRTNRNRRASPLASECPYTLALLTGVALATSSFPHRWSRAPLPAPSPPGGSRAVHPRTLPVCGAEARTNFRPRLVSSRGQWVGRPSQEKGGTRMRGGAAPSRREWQQPWWWHASAATCRKGIHGRLEEGGREGQGPS